MSHWKKNEVNRHIGVQIPHLFYETFAFNIYYLQFFMVAFLEAFQFLTVDVFWKSFLQDQRIQ